MTKFIKFKDSLNNDVILETTGLVIYSDIHIYVSETKTEYIILIEAINNKFRLTFSTQQERDEKFKEFEKLLGLSE